MPEQQDCGGTALISRLGSLALSCHSLFSLIFSTEHTHWTKHLDEEEKWEQKLLVSDDSQAAVLLFRNSCCVVRFTANEQDERRASVDI